MQQTIWSTCADRPYGGESDKEWPVRVEVERVQLGTRPVFWAVSRKAGGTGALTQSSTHPTRKKALAEAERLLKAS